MTHLHEHIRAAGHEVSLTEAEKSRMRDTLHAYMALTPRREPISYMRPVRSYSFAFAHRALAALSVFAILGSSAGVSFAAESALPGEALYAIKTRINEPLRGVLATTPDAKARWAMDVVATRATEAATLAAEDRLDLSTQSQLAASLSEHAQIASALLDDTARAPAAAAQTATRFEAKLSEYERVIASLGDMEGEAVVASAIHTERDRLAVIIDKTDRSSDAALDDAHDEVHALARGRLDAAERTAKRNSDAFTPSIASTLADSIQTASATLAATENGQAPSTTREDLRRTLESSERLATFVETSAAIHEKTGLVIEEPREKESSRSRGHGEAAPTAMLMAAMRADTGSSTEATGPVPAQDTSKEARSGKHGEGAGRDGGHERTIEISVPEF